MVPAQGLAAYVEHADAPVRVTHVAKPVAEELAALVATLDDPVVQAMSRASKEAFVTKLLRRNLTDSVRKRDHGRGFTEEDLAAMRDIVQRLDTMAPRARGMLSVAQARMFEELLSDGPDLDRVAAHDAASLRYRSADALLPASLSLLLHSQAQPRFMVASASIKIGASRYFPIARLVVLAGVVLVGAVVVASVVLGRRRG